VRIIHSYICHYYITCKADLVWINNLLVVYSFQKINRVVEDRKSFSVGGAEENRNKNRSELVIPYDRNRVILTPIPGREHSTYINASFIEVSL